MASQKREYFGNRPKFKMQRVEPGNSNRFHLLSNDEEEETRIVKEKIPPIVVDSCHSFSQVWQILGEEYLFKRMSVGTKVICKTLILYEAALKKLSELKYSFYTHKVKDAKYFKLVLFGLPRTDPELLKEEFAKIHNIRPVSLKEIVTKKTTDDDAIYLAEFNKQEVPKSEVIKIKYFSNIAVYWRRPLKGNKGPTQCAKCSMYGHGANNCNRVSVCAVCAGNHDQTECSLAKNAQEGRIVYKCYNCSKKNLRNVNHRSDDPKCPCRKDYLEMRFRITSRSRSNFNRPRNNYVYDDAEFHQLSSQQQQNDRRESTSQNRRLYSEVSQSRPRVSNNDDDISNERLLEIFFNAVDALEKCRNKFDKLRVLGMMLKQAI